MVFFMNFVYIPEVYECVLNHAGLEHGHVPLHQRRVAPHKLVRSNQETQLTLLLEIDSQLH